MSDSHAREASVIPASLRERNQWVCAKGKEPRRPDDPRIRARTNDATTWGTYTQARAMVEQGQADAAGYVFSADDPYVGVDLDHCRDAETGEIEDWAQEIIERLDSFSQPSISGTGVHIFVEGTLEHAHKQGNVEIYDRGRYFVTPESHLEGTPSEIFEVGDVLDLLQDLLPDKKKAPTRRSTPRSEDKTLRASDEDVLKSLQRGGNAAKFKALYAGEWERAGDYPSKSEADCALVSLIAAKASSYDQVDRIFRSSGLMDAKWDESHFGDGQTYGEHTIEFVLEDTDDESEVDMSSMVDALLYLLKDLELFCDPREEAYAAVHVDGHIETHRIRGTSFERLVGMYAYRTFGKAPKAEVRNSVIDTLDARARYEGGVEEVFVRVGRAEGKVYVDLGDPTWSVVEIDKDGWRVLEQSPVRFKRRAGMLALPTPLPGGSLGWLRPCLNVPDDSSWALLVGFLVGALHPSGPYPIGILQGEQGSAKSTTARLLRALLDPASPQLRNRPGSIDDLIIGAANSWLLAFDNLSSIKADLADMLCQLSTGGGHAKRGLYTNDEEVIFDLKRPVLVNGITDLAKRNDLADRAVVVHMPRIAPADRRREAQVMLEFQEVYPKIVGALYDAISCALRRFPEVELEGHPRMADFAAWVVAAEPALPVEDGEFLAAYERNQTEIVTTALESDPIAVGVLDLAYRNPGWQGTKAELLHCINATIAEEHRRGPYWPKNSRAFGDRLSRIGSFLAAVGVTIEDARDNKRNRCKIVVLQVDESVPKLELDAGFFGLRMNGTATLKY